MTYQGCLSNSCSRINMPSTHSLDVVVISLRFAQCYPRTWYTLSVSLVARANNNSSTPPPNTPHTTSYHTPHHLPFLSLPKLGYRTNHQRSNHICHTPPAPPGPYATLYLASWLFHHRGGAHPRITPLHQIHADHQLPHAFPPHPLHLPCYPPLLHHHSRLLGGPAPAPDRNTCAIRCTPQVIFR